MFKIDLDKLIGKCKKCLIRRNRLVGFVRKWLGEGWPWHHLPLLLILRLFGLAHMFIIVGILYNLLLILYLLWRESSFAPGFLRSKGLLVSLIINSI